MAGRERLVEANAKIVLGETSSALIGPGIAGGLIQLLTAPFAIAVDAVASSPRRCMLRRMARAARRAARRAALAARWRRRSARAWRSCFATATLRSLAFVAAAWQVLHHMQVAVLILFATRELGLSAGAIGLAYMAGGTGLRHRRGVGGAPVASLRRGRGDRLWPAADGLRLAGVRPDRRLDVRRDAAARRRDAAVRLRRGALRDQLSGAAPGDDARTGCSGA